MAEPITLIVSPVSGRGKAIRKLPEIERGLHEAGISYELIVINDLDHAKQVAQQTARNGSKTLVVAGGDGLLHTVVQNLAQTPATLGIIPVGSGNDFARALGINSIKRAISAIKRGRGELIDLGRVNDTWFACIASVGLDSDVMNIVNKVRRIKGPLVYPYATLRALMHWEHARFTLQFDGDRKYEFSGCNVMVANTPFYGGGMKVAPQADFRDGRFQVVVIEKVGKGYFLRKSPKVFRGAHIGIPEVSVFQASKVGIESDRKFEVVADGESVGTLPLEIEAVSKALRVLR